MNIVARLVVNGATIVGSESCSWEVAREGRYDIRLAPGIWRQLAEHDSSTNHVAVQVELRGLATVEELESRIRGLERAMLPDPWEHFAGELGLWLPKHE